MGNFEARMKIIIMAGGDGSRWGNHTGSPKHLIEISGERLLSRTIRQFQGHGTVEVVGPPEPDNRYVFKGIKTHRSTRCGPSAMYELTELYGSFAYRTVMLHGDVWYSDKAVEVITGHTDGVEGYTWFGRAGASILTGSPHGEIWAVSFWPSAWGQICDVMDVLKEWYDSWSMGVNRRAGAWQIYRVLRGFQWGDHQISGAFVEIDDMTQDFDCPEDYDKWMIAYMRKE